MELSAGELFLFWMSMAVSCLAAAYRLRRLVAAVARGRPAEMNPRAWQRVKDVLIYVLGQKSNLKNHRRHDLTAGGHFFIFWGAAVFGLYYLVFVLAGAGLGRGGPLRAWAPAQYITCG